MIQSLWTLSRQGIPPDVRRKVWPLAIGNVLRVTPSMFDMYTKRARWVLMQIISRLVDPTATVQESARAAHKAVQHFRGRQLHGLVGRLWDGVEQQFCDVDVDWQRSVAAPYQYRSTAHLPSATIVRPRRTILQVKIPCYSIARTCSVLLPLPFPLLPPTSQLRTLLETYACFRPDLGYIQGMSYLAAMICLYLPDEL